MADSGFISIKGARVHNLKDIDIKIPRNKLVVITGLSGSGKTTLLKLLMRFYNCTKGSITINGTDISDYTLDELDSFWDKAKQVLKNA